MLTNTARSIAVSHFVYAGLSLPIILNFKKYMGELFQHRETFLVSILKGQLVNKFRLRADLHYSRIFLALQSNVFAKPFLSVHMGPM